MNKVFHIVMMTLFLGLSASAAFSQTASIRDQIAAVERHADQMIAHKQINKALYTDDFQGHDSHGDTFNKQQAIHNVRSILSMAQSVQQHTTILNFMPTAGGAVVVSEQKAVVKILGQRTHKVHVLSLDGKWRSVWVKTRRGWRVRRENQLSDKITKDGVVQVSKASTAKPR